MTGASPGRGARTGFLLEGLALAAAAAILGSQLLVPPIVGLADNGDFDRVMEPCGIRADAPYADRFFAWVCDCYRFDPRGIRPGGFLTSERLFVLTAIPVNRLFSTPGGFRIEAMGSVQAAALLAALGLLLAATRPLPKASRIGAAALLLLIFTDVAYASYLNSFYSEPASLIFLLLWVALALAAARVTRPGVFAAFLAAAALFVATKPQNALLSIPLAALAARLATRLPGLWRRRGFAAAGLLALLGVWYHGRAPREMRRVILYDAVFRGLLAHSSDPVRDLEALGLPRDLAPLAGKTAYQPGSRFDDPALEPEFFARTSFGDVFRFYAARPGRALVALARAAPRAFHMRPPHLGNYEKASGRPAGSLARSFAYWSDLKSWLPLPAAALALFFAASVAAALRLRGRIPAARAASEIWLVVALIAAYQFALVLLGEGDHELEKHLFLFHACVDLQVVGLALSAPALFRGPLARSYARQEVRDQEGRIKT
ncbi:MAG: hypothetical protein ACRD3M_01465 [Thermoanaerobaculia bacterium]